MIIMKQRWMLLGMTMAICVTAGGLCTACTPKQEDTFTLYAASSEKAVEQSDDSLPESTPAVPSPATTEIPAASESDPLMDPDMMGNVATVEQDYFTVTPIITTDIGNGGAVAAGGFGDEVTIHTENAVFETMRIYNGGHEEPQPADTSVLKEGVQVYLYGTRQEDSFAAERVIALEMGDKAE